ncbi:hypothetical protein T09_5866 [Trichinella sp. T9]|nr:hypothetical protein T09_5866 [Trichinella sp. T9]
MTNSDTIKEVVDPKSGDDTTSVVEAMKLASILRIFTDVSKMKSYQRVEECISYCARKKIRDKGLAERLTAVKNNLVNDVKILLCEEHSKTPDVAAHSPGDYCAWTNEEHNRFPGNLLARMDLTDYFLKSTLVQLFDEFSSKFSKTAPPAAAQKAARRRDSLPTCSERIASLARKNDIVFHFAREDRELEAAMLAQDKEKIHEILGRVEKDSEDLINP